MNILKRKGCDDAYDAVCVICDTARKVFDASICDAYTIYTDELNVIETNYHDAYSSANDICNNVHDAAGDAYEAYCDAYDNELNNKKDK